MAEQTATKYTVRNLKEVDNQATNFGVSYEWMAPGYRQPFGHKHKRQEEIYIVVSGSLRAKLDDDIVELKQWDAVRIGQDTMRALEAGPEGAEFIAIGAPNTGPGDGDTVMGWWAD